MGVILIHPLEVREGREQKFTRHWVAEAEWMARQDSEEHLLAVTGTEEFVVLTGPMEGVPAGQTPYRVVRSAGDQP